MYKAVSSLTSWEYLIFCWNYQAARKTRVALQLSCRGFLSNWVKPTPLWQWKFPWGACDLWQIFTPGKIIPRLSLQLWVSLCASRTPHLIAGCMSLAIVKIDQSEASTGVLLCDMCYIMPEKLILFTSQQTHACWELKNWSPSTLLVCGHFIQIHSSWVLASHACTQIWFGIFYRDNLVLMRLLHIQWSWVMVNLIILLNCILNGIAWEQALQWKKKAKKQGQIGKISHCCM